MPKKRKPIQLKFVTRPPAGKNGIPLDPADWPAMRRWKAIYKRVAYKGVPEEVAIAEYDRPLGVCAEKRPNGSICGITAWKKTARLCADCKRRRQNERCRNYKGALRTKTCQFPGCEKQFQTYTDRTVYCPDHKYGKGVSRKRVPSAKKAEPRQPALRQLVKPKIKPKKLKPLPATWEEKKMKQELFVHAPTEKPKPVDVSGHTVTYCQPIPGLRDLFGSGRSAAD